MCGAGESLSIRWYPDTTPISLNQSFILGISSDRTLTYAQRNAENTKVCSNSEDYTDDVCKGLSETTM